MRAASLRLAALLAIGHGAGCGGGAGADGGDSTDLGIADLSRSVVEAPPDLRSEPLPTIAAVHELQMARTCSLNNGVCHNNKEYPDLRSLSALLATARQPCNVNLADKAQYKDVCEPAGDRLVIPWANVDEEIAWVELGPMDIDVLDWRNFASTKPVAVVTLARPVAPFTIPMSQPAFSIQRGGITFPLRVDLDGRGLSGIYVKSVAGATITLGLDQVDYRVVASLNGFLDDRKYPWTANKVRVADPNHNGVLGHGRGVSLLVPGQPQLSYLYLRLVDPAAGDLMPRVCRTWDERGLRALGCWIEGLREGADGTLLNPYDPIDFANCRTDTTARGMCSSQTGAAANITNVEALFARSCGGANCHIGQQAGALDLSMGKARANLVGVESAAAKGKFRVVSGSPAESYLMCKLNRSCAIDQGDHMPLGAPALASEDVALLSAWILDGAK